MTSPVVTDTIASSSSLSPPATSPERQSRPARRTAARRRGDRCRRSGGRCRRSLPDSSNAVAGIARLECPEASRDEEEATCRARRPGLLDEALGSGQPAAARGRLAAEHERQTEPERAPRGPLAVTGVEAREVRPLPRAGAGIVLTDEVGGDGQPLEVVAAERGAAASSSSYASRHERRSNASRPSSTRVVTANSLATSPRTHGHLSRQTLGHADRDPRLVQPHAVHRGGFHGRRLGRPELPRRRRRHRRARRHQGPGVAAGRVGPLDARGVGVRGQGRPDAGRAAQGRAERDRRRRRRSRRADTGRAPRRSSGLRPGGRQARPSCHVARRRRRRRRATLRRRPSSRVSCSPATATRR